MRIRFPTFGPAQMVLTLAVLLLGLFAYAFLQTAAQSYRLRESERILFDEVQVLRQQHAELEGLAAYLESDEYVEAFARQQFGLVRPGERWWEALFDTSLPPSPAPAASEASETPTPTPTPAP